LSGAQIRNARGESPIDRVRDHLAPLVHRQPLLFLAAAVAAGILLDSKIHIQRAVWLGLLAALAVVVVIVCTLPRNFPKLLTGMLFLAMFVIVGAYRHRASRQAYESASILQIASDEAKPAIIEGIIDTPTVLQRHPLADQPSRRDQSPWQTQISVLVQRIRVGQGFEPLDGRVLVIADGRVDERRPGDPVRVYGLIRRFAGPSNPGETDLRDSYRQRDLHALLIVDSIEQIVVLPQPPASVGWVQRGWLMLNRFVAEAGTFGRDQLLQHTSESTGPIAVALVVGQRDFVDTRTQDLLLVTGTAHLLSVSGLHLAIIVVLASWTATLLRMPMALRIGWILGICLLYTAITGGRPPVMRAAVLVATFTIAIWIRRPSQPLNTLALAALILSLWNPENVFNIGVQLSFLAVATLVVCGRRERGKSAAVDQTIQQEARLQSLIETSHSRPIFAIRYTINYVLQVVWYSSCVTAISMPLVWHQFHVVSLISVITNVVLGPLLFAALASGVGTVVFGIVPPLDAICGFICSYLLMMMNWWIEYAASFRWGHVWLPAPPTWWMLTFYVVILVTLCLPLHRVTNVVRYAWILFWFVVALVLATTPPRLDQGSLEATFVDVGHGTSVVLRFAENDVWLYDCGRLGNDTGSSRDIDATLWSLGVTRLQGIMLSHADADHFNALPGILRRFAVQQIITPPGMLSKDEPALQAIRQAIKQAGVKVIELADGDTIQTSHEEIEILHPPLQRLDGSDNANSMVLQINCGGKPLILPGDLEPPGTEFLIRHERSPPGGVLMAPHHGSLSMDASSVLQWSRPSETIVSGGQRAGRPEVEQMLSQTGSAVYVTNQVGAIRVVIDQHGQIEVRSWTQSSW
jgi:competence protein ComEC